MCNVEQLISEVESRECIWKSTNVQYQDKDARKKAWHEILLELYPHFESFSAEEGMKVGTEVQKKWRNIKDSFMKELKRQKKRKSGAPVYSKRKKYVYFDRLSFLLSQDDDEKSEDKIQIDQCPIKSEPKEPEETIPPSKKHCCQTNGNMMLGNIPITKTTDDKLDLTKMNDDLAFFLSLVPSVQKLDEDQKLSFRMKVLRILKNVKRKIKTEQQFQIFDPLHIVPSSTAGTHFLCDPNSVSGTEMGLSTPGSSSNRSSRSSSQMSDYLDLRNVR